MIRSLETVLADARSDIQVYRRGGINLVPVDTFDDVLTAVRQAAAPLLTYLSETEAMLYSGKSKAWLRQRFARWQQDGHARTAPTNSRERQYLQIILPRREDKAAVRADAAAAARADAKVGAR